MFDIVKICQKTIELTFYILLVLTPLILTPWNYELFEFNKMLLVYAGAVIIAGFWVIEMVALKKLIFKRSFWDIPLLIFLGGQVLATIFSIDLHTSLWGYYSRFNGGLFSTVSYLILYWAFVTHATVTSDGGRLIPNEAEGEAMTPPRWVRNAIYLLLFSGALVAAYGIAEHFGIDAQYWVQDVKNRVFSSLGQPNWLAAYLVALIPLTWALTLNATRDTPQVTRKNNLLLVACYLLLSAIFYLCLLYTKSKSGLIGFAFSFFVFWPLSFFLFRQQFKVIAKPFIIHTSLFIILSLAVGTPWTANIKNIKYSSPAPNSTPAEGPTGILISETGDIRKVVWKGAIEIWKNYPLFGTGVETFAYSYYWYRPREHNDLSEWDFLYNKAHNEYLNYLATTGIIGLGSYLTLIAFSLFWGFKKISNFQLGQLEIRLIRLSILSGFASILVSNFFGFSVVPVSLLFFLFPAVSQSLSSGPTANSPPRCRTYLQKFAIVLLLFLILNSEFLILKYWYADTRYALADRLFKSDQSSAAFNQLQTAVKLKDDEPVYHNQLALVAADLSLIYDKDKQATLSSQLKTLALGESEKALKVSPYNLNFWKDRTKIAYKLAEIDPEYYQLALTSLFQAADLAPTDAKIQLNLGILYSQLGQPEKAVATLLKSIELKPNYEVARYTLALFYEEKKEFNKAKEQLDYILEKINANYQPAKEKLKELEVKTHRE